MDYIVVIGSVATSPKIIAFFSLLQKMSKTKSIKDNSLGTFLVLYRRVFFWIVCRMLTVDPPVTVGISLHLAKPELISTCPSSEREVLGAH